MNRRLRIIVILLLLFCANGWVFAAKKKRTYLMYESPQHIIQLKKILHQSISLNPFVLELGLRAYRRATRAGIVRKRILTLIDYSLPSAKKRFWVIDLAHNVLLFHTVVAQGKGSGTVHSRHFSDQPRSYASSIGTYLTGHGYIGKHGYSLRLYGLARGFNDKAYKRSIVIHHAWYVNDAFIRKHGRLGRSWGCPALDHKISTNIINTIKDGSIILAYYPDKRWLYTSKFVTLGRHIIIKKKSLPRYRRNP